MVRTNPMPESDDQPGIEIQVQANGDDTQAHLLGHLQHLVRPRHSGLDPIGLMSVRSYIKEELGRFGNVEEHRFKAQGQNGCNLLLKLPGRVPSKTPLLVGAHYDGPANSPGADDNATGVAALLVLAQRLAIDPPQRPIWLVAFDLEEWGMLGSQALAHKLKESGQRLKLMLSLEMLGYTSPSQRYPIDGMERIYGDRGEFIAIIGNVGATPSMISLAGSMGAHIPTKVLPVVNRGRQIAATRQSDHSPFWDEGYDAVMVTDTAFLRNPHYHKATDTIETLNLDFLASSTKGLIDSVRSL